MDYQNLNEQREARLRLKLADAHLKAADKGALEAAVIELVNVMRGRGTDGKPIQVSARTRARAADALLRHSHHVATMSAAKRVQISGDGDSPLEVSLVDVVRLAAEGPKPQAKPKRGSVKRDAGEVTRMTTEPGGRKKPRGS